MAILSVAYYAEPEGAAYRHNRAQLCLSETLRWAACPYVRPSVRHMLVVTEI